MVEYYNFLVDRPIEKIVQLIYNFVLIFDFFL